MGIAPHTPGTALRCILAALVALAASACTAPDADPAGTRQVADRGGPSAQALPGRGDPTAQVPPADPIKVIGDTLEAQVRIILAAAHPDPTR